MRPERLALLEAICFLVAIRHIVSIRTESLIIVVRKHSNRFGRTGQKRTKSKRGRLATAIATLSLTALTGLTAIGCHRQFYRKQADQEVACLIQEKASHVARRPNTDLGIQVDRRSRMYNPFDLDMPPMPLDDPASHRYMQCVDGRRGYPMWDSAGFTNMTESPDWWQFLPFDEDGVLVLNADSAVQIALLHSTDYQRQLEQLYLSALDVSSERFRFDTQFFGGLGTGYELFGPDRSKANGQSGQRSAIRARQPEHIGRSRRARQPSPHATLVCMGRRTCHRNCQQYCLGAERQQHTECNVHLGLFARPTVAAAGRT